MKAQEFFNLANLRRAEICCRDCKFSEHTWSSLEKNMYLRCMHPLIDEDKTFAPNVNEYCVCDKFEKLVHES